MACWPPEKICSGRQQSGGHISHPSSGRRRVSPFRVTGDRVARAVGDLSLTTAMPGTGNGRRLAQRVAGSPEIIVRYFIRAGFKRSPPLTGPVPWQAFRRPVDNRFVRYGPSGGDSLAQHHHGRPAPSIYHRHGSFPPSPLNNTSPRRPPLRW
ncbi:hypothetical protein ACOMHN_000802 [Nucella lapillus]